MVNVYKILKETTVEGPGNRFCIWVQGCKKQCPECWAKDTWNFGCGKEYSIEELFKMMDKSKIEGITFLGGEPFEQAKELSKLSKMVKEVGLSVACFTGYTIEELHSKGDVYELLLHLNPYVELDDSPETFKPTFMDSPLGILVRYLLWGWY